MIPIADDISLERPPLEGRRPIRVLITAAYSAVRAGLHALLQDADDLAIVGEIRGSAELERVLAESCPEVVLFDYNEADGAQMLEVLSGRDTALVVLGESRNGYELLADAVLPGWAYLLKEAEEQEIAGAIRAVAAGLIVLDSSLSLALRPASPGPARSAEAGAEAPGEALTNREREVLQLMAEGLPNKLIATRLHISLHTVKFHVASILGKTGAASRTEAVTLGARRGYIYL